MLTIVIDTNCLLAAVPRRSKFYWLYELLKTGQLRLAVSTEILEEYEELLGSFYSPEFAELVMKTLVNLPELAETTVHFNWRLIHPDLDDNKFVDTSVAANADFLITHDGDFKILDAVPFPVVRRISMPDFHRQFFGKEMPEKQA